MVDTSNGIIVVLRFTMRHTWDTQGTFYFYGFYSSNAGIIKRNYVTQDILRRIMSDYFGYDVHFVMNVTDIDDKVRVYLPLLLSPFEYWIDHSSCPTTTFSTGI